MLNTLYFPAWAVIASELLLEFRVHKRCIDALQKGQGHAHSQIHVHIHKDTIPL